MSSGKANFGYTFSVSKIVTDATAALESFFGFQHASEDKRVQSRLIDNCHISILAAVVNRDISFIFLVYMAVNISTTVLVPEDISHTFLNKPRFILVASRRIIILRLVLRYEGL